MSTCWNSRGCYQNERELSDGFNCQLWWLLLSVDVKYNCVGLQKRKWQETVEQIDTTDCLSRSQATHTHTHAASSGHKPRHEGVRGHKYTVWVGLTYSSKSWQSVSHLNYQPTNSFQHRFLASFKGSYDAISSFAFSLECYKLIVIDKIPEVAKTKVLKPNR